MKSATKSQSDQRTERTAAPSKAATFVNHGPEAIAQRKMANAVNNSPQMVTQREVAETIRQSPQMAALRGLSSFTPAQPIQRFLNLAATRGSGERDADITNTTSGPNASIAEGEMVGFSKAVDGISVPWKTQVKWGPLNAADPKAGTLMEANPLGPDHPQGSEPGDTRPDDWIIGMGVRKMHYVQGHLLNDNLGGTGTDKRNLTPITHDANDMHSRHVETPIRKEVNEKKRWVYYKVKVNYPTASPTGAPSAYEGGIAKELETTWYHLDTSGNQIGPKYEETIPNVPPFPMNNKSGTTDTTVNTDAIAANVATSSGEYKPFLSNKHNKKAPVSDEFPNEAELVKAELNQWGMDVDKLFNYIITDTILFTRGVNGSFKERAQTFDKRKPDYKKKSSTYNKAQIEATRLADVRTAVHNWRRGLQIEFTDDFGVTNGGAKLRKDGGAPMDLDPSATAALQPILNWNPANPFTF